MADKETDQKATEEAQAKAKAKTKMNEEADTLGIKRSRTSVASSRIVDKDKEGARHEKLADARVANRIKKAKAKPLSDMEKRKRLLKAKLTHAQDFPKEQVRQARYELELMRQKKWKPGYNVTTKEKCAGIMAPKSKTAYAKIMGE